MKCDFCGNKFKDRWHNRERFGLSAVYSRESDDDVDGWEDQ